MIHGVLEGRWFMSTLEVKYSYISKKKIVTGHTAHFKHWYDKAYRLDAFARVTHSLCVFSCWSSEQCSIKPVFQTGPMKIELLVSLISLNMVYPTLVPNFGPILFRLPCCDACLLGK